MAHNVETMAYTGQVPWHGLGKKVPSDLTSDQMLQAAGLDWEVVKTPLYYDSDTEDDYIEEDYSKGIGHYGF